MRSGLQIVAVHLLHAGGIGYVECGHSLMLVLRVTGIGQYGSLGAVKYLYLVYCHSVFQVVI